MGARKKEPLIIDDEPITIDDMVEWSRVLSKAKKTHKKGVAYYELAASFDIETTSLYHYEGADVVADGACMYVWQFGLHGKVCLGRTWDSFLILLDKISEVMKLDHENRLAIYCHNLAFEFQWLRFRVNVTEVFALANREPIRALINDCFEFRCSMVLFGGPLAKINLLDYKISKKGGFDYTKKRGAATPLTRDEELYCIYDVLVVMAYVWEVVLHEKTSIAGIRLTKTGRVRKLLRKHTIYNSTARWGYMRLISQLTLDFDEYLSQRRAFAGGYTHTSATKTGKIFQEVPSYDIGSSYPTALVSELYPMKKGVKALRDDYTIEELLEWEENKQGAIFDIELWDVVAIFHYEHIISASKCFILEEPVIDNGRIASCKHLKMTITSIDLWSLVRFYKFDNSKVKIDNLWYYRLNYLPKQFVYVILSLYGSKTKLKNVGGMEFEYMSSKEDINSVYGDEVMDPVRQDIEYTSDWKLTREVLTDDQVKSKIEKYNENKNRYNYYAWGVFCTAYSRRNLFKGILAQGPAYLYADTDSLKLDSRKINLQFFDEYNKEIDEKIKKALTYHKLPLEMAAPETQKGEKKPLGHYEYEETYKTFKALGAKRYMYQTQSDELHITIAGLNKISGAEFLDNTDEPFEQFKFGLAVPDHHSGRLTSHYIDKGCSGRFTDYLGNTCYYEEKSAVCLSPATFNLKHNTVYESYYTAVQNGGFDKKAKNY